MAESTHSIRLPSPQTPGTSTASSTARFELPAKGFALAELFERVPDARVKIEPAVANPDDHALLVVRAGAHERTVDAALRASSGVAAVECFGERPGGWMYRVTWKGYPHQVIQHFAVADITLLSAQGQDGRWKLRVLTPDRDGISRAYEVLDDRDCRVDCRRISSFDGGRMNRSTLTDQQREALIEAFEKGYYDIPRDVTMVELSDEIGISHQALSERFRRAYRKIVEAEFVDTENG